MRLGLKRTGLWRRQLPSTVRTAASPANKPRCGNYDMTCSHHNPKQGHGTYTRPHQQPGQRPCHSATGSPSAVPLLAGLSPQACKRHTHVSLVHLIDAGSALQSSHDWHSRCRTGIKALKCQTRQDSKAKMAANRAQHDTRKNTRGCSMCLSPLANQVGKMKDTEGANPTWERTLLGHPCWRPLCLQQ